MNEQILKDFNVNKFTLIRYEKTLSFIKKTIPDQYRVLDLGVPNPFSEILNENGYTVFNTSGEDLDFQPQVVDSFQNVEFVTALEIFEHMLNPMGVLQRLPANKLIASIPLSLWFANAYRSKTDPWDRHYHEFEDWQFDWLLEKSGWKIISSEKWNGNTDKIGIRPFLRKITPRYYIVYAERIQR